MISNRIGDSGYTAVYLVNGLIIAAIILYAETSYSDKAYNVALYYSLMQLVINLAIGIYFKFRGKKESRFFLYSAIGIVFLDILYFSLVSFI